MLRTTAAAATWVYGASEKERGGRGGSVQGSDEGRFASTSGVRAQVWLGFAGTVLAALIALIGTQFGG